MTSTRAGVTHPQAHPASGAARSDSARSRTVSRLLYTLGLSLSGLVGVLHFFAPYAFAWYSYIPDAPREIYVSIDYVNFLFSLLLSGLSLVLLLVRRYAFEGSVEVLAFYTLMVVVWSCRVLVAVVVPWPTALHTWLLLGAAVVLAILVVPLPHLVRTCAAAR